jgi:hypothetical protein
LDFSTKLVQQNGRVGGGGLACHSTATVTAATSIPITAITGIAVPIATITVSIATATET